MKIAFLSIENGFWLNKTTILSNYISYLEPIFPDDLIYPISDLDFLIKTNPEIVFIYQSETFLFDKVIEISTQIKKELGIPVILLGNHITYMPKTLPESIDIGILGEGEQQLEKIISLFKKGKPDERSLSKIANIVFNSKKQNIIIGKPSFTQDINSIDLTRKNFYKMPGNWRFSISTGRGNPHKNIYSQNTEFPVRLNSIDFIIKDIVDIVTYFPEIKKVPILDNVFLHDFTRFKTFCETAKEGDLTKYLKLEVFARDYELNDEILNLLRYYLKVYRLNIILTPISENIQKENKYPNIKKEKLVSILDLCYKLNINTKIHNSLFHSNENIEDSSKNYWFISNITKQYNYFFDIENKIVVPKVGSFDGGFGASYLARVVGQKKAREIWYLCEQYDAQEALDMGLVNKVVPLDKLEETTVDWCKKMLTKSHTALRLLKSSFNAELDGQAGIQELAGNATLLYYLSEEAKEGKNAFIEKREPNFDDYTRFP